MSKIIFMGDSITEYMPYVFKGNIGSEGDEIQYRGISNIGVGNYMNYVWPRINHEDVDTYILLIGTNNISRPDCDHDRRETLDDLVDKLKEFINKIVSSNTSRLLVQSIYPTKYSQSSEKIIFVNEKIKAYCDNIGIEYIDLHSLLTDEEGLFNKKYSDDGIHPNVEGYRVIAEVINNQLKLNPTKMLRREKRNNITDGISN